MASSDAPPGVDLNEDIRWTILGPVITLVILATAAVALRVASRKVSNLQLQWDDYLIMGALVRDLPASAIFRVFGTLTSLF